MARLHRFWNRRYGCRALCIDVTASTVAVSMVGTAGTSFIGSAGNCRGRDEGMPAQQSRRRYQFVHVAGHPKRRHGVFAFARRFENVAALVQFARDISGLTGNSYRIFHFLVIRFELVVRERPVFDGRTLRDPRRAVAPDCLASHLEVPGIEPPALPPVVHRGAADGIHHLMGALDSPSRGIGTNRRPFPGDLLSSRRPAPATQFEFVGRHVLRTQP